MKTVLVEALEGFRVAASIVESIVNCDKFCRIHAILNPFESLRDSMELIRLKLSTRCRVLGLQVLSITV